MILCRLYCDVMGPVVLTFWLYRQLSSAGRQVKNIDNANRECQWRSQAYDSMTVGMWPIGEVSDGDNIVVKLAGENSEFKRR